MKDYLEIGQIVNTHGLKGYIKVVPFTDSINRFEELTKIYIQYKKELIELLMQAQELHCKNRPDIFKKTTKKEVESEVIEVLESKERKMIVAVNDKEKVWI